VHRPERQLGGHGPLRDGGELPELGLVPKLPKMAKDYVDVPVGSVVEDDPRVDQVLVLLDTQPRVGVEVTARCLPLSILEAELDPRFRTLDAGGLISTVTPDGRHEPDWSSRGPPNALFLDAAPNPRWRGRPRPPRRTRERTGASPGPSAHANMCS
jgi:hypothetical protein